MCKIIVNPDPVDSRTHRTDIVCPYCKVEISIPVNAQEFVDSLACMDCPACSKRFNLIFKIVAEPTGAK